MHFAAKSLLLKDSEQRWQRRFEDAKRQEDASHARRETWTWTILDHSHKLPKKGLRFHCFTRDFWRNNGTGWNRCCVLQDCSISAALAKVLASPTGSSQGLRYVDHQIPCGEASVQGMELQCQYLQSELDRCKVLWYELRIF